MESTAAAVHPGRQHIQTGHGERGRRRQSGFDHLGIPDGAEWNDPALLYGASELLARDSRARVGPAVPGVQRARPDAAGPGRLVRVVRLSLEPPLARAIRRNWGVPERTARSSYCMIDVLCQTPAATGTSCRTIRSFAS